MSNRFMQHLQECLENRFYRKNLGGRLRRVGGTQKRRVSKGNSWSCGKPGHMQQDCSGRELSAQPLSNKQGNRGMRSKAWRGVQNWFRIWTMLWMVTPGSVGGGISVLTVDTGSNISIVHTEVLKRSSINADIQPVENQLCIVTGDSSHSRKNYCATVGPFHAEQQVWVAEIADECILGLDFFQQHNCRVDLKEGILHIVTLFNNLE